MICARAFLGVAVRNNLQLKIVGCCSSPIVFIANRQNESIQPEQFRDGIARSSNLRDDGRILGSEAEWVDPSFLKVLARSWSAAQLAMWALCRPKAHSFFFSKESQLHSTEVDCIHAHEWGYGNSPSLEGDGALTFRERYVSLRRTLGAAVLKSVACRTPKCWLH